MRSNRFGVVSLLLITLFFSGVHRGLSQTDFLRIKSFGNIEASAATPWCVPLEASDGFLYGTTSEGGTNEFGSVFKVGKDGGGLTFLHRFAGAPTDGQSPQGGLIEGDDGALYGATYLGGSNNLGTIFRLAKDGTTFSILRHLDSTDGIKPQGSLLKGSDGALYGTTASTVFKMNTDGGGFMVLHGFGGAGDGANPQFGVIEASDGILYGATSTGGSNNLGTVFKLTKDGGSYALLHSFDTTNGRGPQAGLLEASNGILYGTTSYRATNSYGTVFQLDKTGASFAVLRTFWGTNSEGWYPQSALVEGNDGALYGTTINGGLEGQGTIFKLNPDGSGYGIVHHFSWDNADGRIPLAGLMKSTNGLFYGTASLGGAADYGSLFEFNPANSNCVPVVSFSWTGGDGWNPQSSLTEASDGLLYGTTFNGGSNDFGTVFRMNKDRSGYTVLHHFNWRTDGAFPQGTVIEATNGALYGTAFEGGSNNLGTVFTLNKDGSGFSVLRHFGGLKNDPSHPQAGLLQGSDGTLYGTSAQNASLGVGTVFKLNLNGTGFTLLRTNSGASGEITPLASLIEGSDGNLYGMASGGGAPTNGAGSIFRLDKAGGSFTNIHSFTGSTLEGRGLMGSLVEGTNGLLYGTTFSRSTNGVGGVFSINKDGSSFKVLRSFLASADAKNPVAGLTLGSNGALYGTAFNGSATNLASSTNWGAVFKINHDGSGYEVVCNLSALTDGRNPAASLILSSDGAFYTTASAGGDMNAGAIFSLAEPPTFTGLQFGGVGALVQFQAVSSRTYALQATTNLAPAFWQPVATITGTNSLFQFLDSDATNYSAKFYRTQTQ